MLNLSAFKLQNPSLLKNLNQFQQVIQLFRNHSIPPLWIGSTDQLTGSNLLADDPPRVRRSGWDLSPLAMDGEGSRGNVDHTHPRGKSSACDFWQWAELFCLEIEFQTGRSHHVYDELWGYARNPSRLFFVWGVRGNHFIDPAPKKAPGWRGVFFGRWEEDSSSFHQSLIHREW